MRCHSFTSTTWVRGMSPSTYNTILSQVLSWLLSLGNFSSLPSISFLLVPSLPLSAFSSPSSVRSSYHITSVLVFPSFWHSGYLLRIERDTQLSLDNYLSFIFSSLPLFFSFYFSFLLLFAFSFLCVSRMVFLNIEHSACSSLVLFLLSSSGILFYPVFSFSPPLSSSPLLPYPFYISLPSVNFHAERCPSRLHYSLCSSPLTGFAD